MAKMINTPCGKMNESSYTRRFVAAITDLFILVTTAGIIGIFIQNCFSSLFDFQSSYIPLLIFVLASIAFLLIPRIYNLKTPGQWALGLKSFKFNELPNYSGRGKVWCIENHPGKEYTRRITFVAGYLASFYLITWLIYSE